MKRLVKDLIKQKQLQDFGSVSPQASVLEALYALEEINRSALLVIENGQLKGIFSEKDFARAALRGGVHLSQSVETVMTDRIYYVDPTFNLEQCLQIMSKLHIRHLPVLENGRPTALLSMRDIMEVLVEDKESQIRDLTSYITGRDHYELPDPSADIVPPQIFVVRSQEAI